MIDWQCVRINLRLGGDVEVLLSTRRVIGSYDKNNTNMNNV